MKRILVYGSGEIIGDGLMKLPFLHGLRHHFPGAHITWYCGVHSSVYETSLKEIARPYLDQIITRTGWLEVAKQLSSTTFDVVINTRSVVLSPMQLRLCLKAKTRFSPAAGFWLSDYKPVPSYQKPRRIIEQLLSYLTLISGKAGPEKFALSLPESLKQTAQLLLPGSPLPYIGVAPGAGDRKKCWPKAHYMALAQQLIEIGFKPVMFLGPQEQEWVAEFQAALPKALFPLQDPRLQASSPLQTIALAQRCTVTVTNDCGTGHMFALSGVPLISLFGPTSAAKLAPYTTQGQVITAQTYGGDEMALIPVQDVFQAIMVWQKQDYQQ
jgi:ADP-heptose:LPS heptosyltransferase